jgi:hypothetical protein
MENLKNIRALRPAGFWCEHSGDKFPSVLSASVKPIASPELEQIEGYLADSPICVASSGIAFSAFDKTKIAGTNSIRTDGVWVWSDTFPYYVRHHGVEIPADFQKHIRDRKYSPPEEIEIDLGELIFPW